MDRLPLEILWNVIHTSLINTPKRDYYRTVLSLRTLCTKWRNAIDACPQLWTLVYGPAPPSFIKTSIERSGVIPLDVHTFYWGRTGYAECDEALNSNLWRWKSAHITFRSPLRATELPHWPILQDAAPELECLTLRLKNPGPQPADGDLDGVWPIRFFQGGAPKLTSLQQEGFRLDWKSGIFQGLKVWNLSGRSIRCPDGRLLNVLAGCYRLERLSMNSIDLYVDHLAACKARLPALKQLAITESRWAQPWVFLMKNLDVPEDASLALSFHPPTWIAMTSSTETESVAGSIRQRVFATLKLDVTMSLTGIIDMPSTLTLTSPPGEGHLALNFVAFDSTELMDAVHIVLDIFEPTDIQGRRGTLSVGGNENTFMSISELSLILLFSYVDEIGLDLPRVPDVEGILRLLGEPSCYDKEYTWRCPNLERLKLSKRCNASIEEVLGAMKSRYVDVPPNSEESPSLTVTRPSRLQRLQYPTPEAGCGIKERKELCRILGEDVVQFD